jgi:hypothetical protein
MGTFGVSLSSIMSFDAQAAAQRRAAIGKKLNNFILLIIK